MTELARLSPPSAEAKVAPVKGKTAKRRLSRKQKAAIIVRFLLNEGAEVALDALPDGLQADLTHLMGGMGYVDRETLGTVLMEFAQELESIGLAFPNGISGALSALEGRISPLTAARLRKEAGVRLYGDPWTRIKSLDVPDLAGIVSEESTEVAAVLISKLDVGKAAELLSALPGDQARRITYAVSMTGTITPEAVDRIGLTLASQLDDVPPSAFDVTPVDRVGAILNSSTAATRDDLLSALDETDADFAVEVRKTIFTYAHISTRLETRDVPRVIKDVEEDRLVTALAYATGGEAGATTEFLLNNMSSRLADQLREAVEEKGKVSLAEGEAALTAVTAVIRDLEAEGEIKLITPDDPAP